MAGAAFAQITAAALLWDDGVFCGKTVKDVFVYFAVIFNKF